MAVTPIGRAPMRRNDNDRLGYRTHQADAPAAAAGPPIGRVLTEAERARILSAHRTMLDEIATERDGATESAAEADPLAEDLRRPLPDAVETWRREKAEIEERRERARDQSAARVLERRLLA